VRCNREEPLLAVGCEIRLPSYYEWGLTILISRGAQARRRRRLHASKTPASYGFGAGAEPVAVRHRHVEQRHRWWQVLIFTILRVAVSKPTAKNVFGLVRVR
jgi:hypothetical protein